MYTQTLSHVERASVVAVWGEIKRDRGDDEGVVCS
jgi:hypothetical protein